MQKGVEENTFCVEGKKKKKHTENSVVTEITLQKKKYFYTN